jgi:membrane fusion protein, heavy metal efflux system
MLGRFLIVLLLSILGCRRPADTAVESRPTTRLHYGTQTALYVEIPPLIRDREARLAIHVTELPSFKPATKGRVIVSFGGERVVVEAPSSPGIYGATLRPKNDGSLAIEVEGGETHALGTIRVFAAEEEASAAAPVAPAGVRFLMEQQWRTEFATELTSARPLRPSIEAFGVVRGRPDGDAAIQAPLAGRLIANGPALPKLGDLVAADQILATLAPQIDAAVDVSSLEREVTQARAVLAFAKRERAREEELHAKSLTTEHELLEARREENVALAAVAAAEKRLAQFRATEHAGAPGAAGRVTIRAPVSGTLVSVTGTSNGNVEKGQQLFRVVDLTRLWAELRIPEGDLARLPEVTGAAFFIGGAPGPEVSKDKLISFGAAVDPITRTAPLLFDIGAAARVGASIRARVFSGASTTSLAVPLDAVVDDDGTAAVFVQLDGEVFERRLVTPGIRDGGFVQIVSGLTDGVRIVTRGAWAVRLAAAAGSLPAHGHEH